MNTLLIILAGVLVGLSTATKDANLRCGFAAAATALILSIIKS